MISVRYTTHEGGEFYRTQLRMTERELIHLLRSGKRACIQPGKPYFIGATERTWLNMQKAHAIVLPRGWIWDSYFGCFHHEFVKKVSANESPIHNPITGKIILE